MKHPNLVWEARSMDGRLVSCLLARGALAHTVVQYVDEMLSNVEEFDDLDSARERVRVLFVDTARRAADRSGNDSCSRASGGRLGYSCGPTQGGG